MIGSLDGHYTLPWIWAFLLIGLAPWVLGILLAGFVERLQPRPLRRVEADDRVLELWVRERRLPVRGDVIIVPVAPDLQMAAGIAKWVRDSTANSVQQEALRVAPLPPGEAFVGRGAKHRFRRAALAVVMDDQKRSRPEWVRAAVCEAIRAARAEGASTFILPDFTEDLLRQPRTITEEQRLATARPTARALVEAATESLIPGDRVVLWIWRRGTETIYAEELDRVAREVEVSGGSPAPAH